MTDPRATLALMAIAWCLSAAVTYCVVRLTVWLERQNWGATETIWYGLICLFLGPAALAIVALSLALVLLHDLLAWLLYWKSNPGD
jgi:hypothetical protein